MLNRNMKYLVGGLIMLALLTAGGILWYQKRAITNTEPVRIYKATPLKREATPVVKTEVDMSDNGQTTSVDSGTPVPDWHNEEPLTDTSHNETNSPLPEMSRESETLTDETSDAFTADAENLEQIAGEILEEWTNFVEDLRYKYPLLSMSQDEIRFLSQLPEGRQEIRSQAQAIRNETINQIVNLLSHYTSEKAEEILRDIEKQVWQENHNVPPEYIEEALDNIRERLN